MEVKIFKSWLICGTIIQKWENLSSHRKILVIIILRQGFLFLNSKAMHKMLFAISLGLSLLILLAPQWMMTYLRWLGTRKCFTRQRICWVRSPPMMRKNNGASGKKSEHFFEKSIPHLLVTEILTRICSF